MPFAVKLAFANAVIIAAYLAGRRFPSLSGLIATMPLTSLVVMLWLHSDRPDDPALMLAYTRGAVWGILPSVLFFVTAWAALARGAGLWTALAAGGLVWLAGAALHQYLLR